jgi:hypothetical protein
VAGTEDKKRQVDISSSTMFGYEDGFLYDAARSWMWLDPYRDQEVQDSLSTEQFRSIVADWLHGGAYRGYERRLAEARKNMSWIQASPGTPEYAVMVANRNYERMQQMHKDIVERDGAIWGNIEFYGAMFFLPAQVNPNPINFDNTAITFGAVASVRSAAPIRPPIDPVAIRLPANVVTVSRDPVAKPVAVAPVVPRVVESTFSVKVVDKSWKLKIEGTAQKTGTPGHQFRTYREAIAEAKNPDVLSVHLDHGYNRGLDLDPKTIQPNRRPDVLSVYNDNSVLRVEVQSRTDIPAVLRSRNAALDAKLRVQGFTPTPPRVVRPTTTP